jgi:hypothetical protein
VKTPILTAAERELVLSGRRIPPIIETAAAYEFCIGRADDGASLNEMRAEIAGDDDLSPEEKAELDQAIYRRFAWLNARAVGEQKPRWDQASPEGYAKASGDQGNNRSPGGTPAALCLGFHFTTL